jgi:peptidyl-tRNA hydrolase, PTH1 family
MKLIVGLGNPGSKYKNTRHNVGFHVIAEVAEVRVDDQVCWLLCPQTYMNESGRSVLEARDFFKVDASDLLVICDDFALPLGALRVRVKGSAGGQKGLADILRRLGTDTIPRLRVGIGPVPDKWDPADFVLGQFTADQIPRINESIRRSADAVATWVRDGIQTCMNQFNTGKTTSDGD